MFPVIRARLDPEPRHPPFRSEVVFGMPSPRLPSKVARLLGLQLLLVPIGLVALLALVVWGTRPNHPPVDTGGIDAINTAIVWIAFFFVFLALGYIHVNFARQLLSESKGTRRGVASW